MLKEPGSEAGETLGTVGPGSGLTGHLGATPTGHHHSQMIVGVRRTVVAFLGLMPVVDGMINNAVLRQPLFARKVKIIRQPA